ncbi:MAG: hypothetical protein WBB20_07490 [Chitinophagaceae bacterium]
MMIADDGNDYAKTNDGTQLLRFSTRKKSEITNLVATLYKAGMTAWQTSDLADCNRQNMFVNWNSSFISTFFGEYIK